MIDKIRIVLVETSHVGNIGAAARSMLNMGFAQLVLVNPKTKPNKESYARASGATSILDNAIIVDTLAEALKDIEFVVGTSARERKISLPVLPIREAAVNIITKAKLKIKCAIVFGRERTGLFNDELLKCHLHTYIPANPNYSSLNLSQAVQVFCYECYISFLSLNETANIDKKVEDSLASQADYEGLYHHWQDMLFKVGFLRQDQPSLIMNKIKRLFQRTRLEKTEVNILRGICSEVLNKIDKEKNKT